MPQQYYTAYLWNCHSTNMMGITMLVCLSCGLMSSAQLKHGKNRFATGDTKSLSPSTRDEAILNETRTRDSGPVREGLRSSRERIKVILFTLLCLFVIQHEMSLFECPASHNGFPKTQPKRQQWERWRGRWHIDWSKRRPVWGKLAGTSQVWYRVPTFLHSVMP